MRRGREPALIERFLHNPLSAPQRDLLLRVLEPAPPGRGGGLDVLVAALSGDEYVEGVSLVVHKAWTWPTATPSSCSSRWRSASS